MDVRRRRSIEGAHAGTAALPGLCSPSSLLSLPMTGLPMTAWSGAGVRRKPTSSVESSGGRVLLEQGDCQTRVMPASTFKIALAITGFDSGVLPDPHAPVLSCKPADSDRGGAATADGPDTPAHARRRLARATRHPCVGRGARDGLRAQARLRKRGALGRSRQGQETRSSMDRLLSSGAAR